MKTDICITDRNNDHKSNVVKIAYKTCICKFELYRNSHGGKNHNFKQWEKTMGN